MDQALIKKMQELKTMLGDIDLTYKWKGFALSFLVVFIFVFLQNLGVNLSWSRFFKQEALQTATETNVQKIDREIPVVKTGSTNSETDSAPTPQSN